MPGSWDLFDFVDLTNQETESSPRTRAINTLQIHHATTTSYSALRSLMDPGGRTVSANGAMANDGELGEVVRTSDRRAFTSSSSFDNQSLTVEVCNISLSPYWGISAACRTRLARLAVGMYRNGILAHLGRGIGGILGHYEVPGTYATACPGPDMHLDWIAAEAQALYAAGDNGLAGGGVPRPIPPAQLPEDEEMTHAYMDKSTGEVRAINVNTGVDHHIKDEAYLDFELGNNVWEKWPATQDANTYVARGYYKPVEANVFRHMRLLAAAKRGAIPSSAIYTPGTVIPTY